MEGGQVGGREGGKKERKNSTVACFGMCKD